MAIPFLMSLTYRRTRRDRVAPAAYNPFAVQRPDFVQQMVIEEEDETRNSLLVIDNRDDRVISPFQNWLAQEIMSNAASHRLLAGRSRPLGSQGDSRLRRILGTGANTFLGKRRLLRTQRLRLQPRETGDLALGAATNLAKLTSIAREAAECC